MLTGDYMQGNRGAGEQGSRVVEACRRPPCGPLATCSCANRAMDCLRQPSIFVVFQAMPTRLITCKHLPGVPQGTPLGPWATSQPPNPTRRPHLGPVPGSRGLPAGHSLTAPSAA